MIYLAASANFFSGYGDFPGTEATVMSISWAARILSFLVGFISLSQEILWVRLVGFCFEGIPQAFGFVLGLYLLAIALGAKLGKRYCTDRYDLFAVFGTLLLCAGVCDILFPFMVVITFNHGTSGTILGAAITIPCIISTSLIKSMVFSIAHHLGSSTLTYKVGSSVSKVYFANIMGSTLGPLVTGLFLLNVASLQTVMMAMAALTIFSGVYCKFVSVTGLSRRIAFGAFLLAPLPLIIPQNLTHILVSNLSPTEKRLNKLLKTGMESFVFWRKRKMVMSYTEIISTMAGSILILSRIPTI